VQIYDRDGATQGEFVRGDMYIRDAKNTKGHITGCTYGEWHPTEKQTALTSSEDGTVRIWDVTNFKQQKQVRQRTEFACFWSWMRVLWPKTKAANGMFEMGAARLLNLLVYDVRRPYWLLLSAQLPCWSHVLGGLMSSTV
jgi:WD40 repeat protein